MQVPITLTIGERVIEGRLHDNPAARAFAERLPLTLTFTDYGDQEKTAPLPEPLPLTGMPSGDDGEPGEIGYYAPNQVLVLYYSRVGRYPGIASLGTWDLHPDALRNLPDGTAITLARA